MVQTISDVPGQTVRAVTPGQNPKGAVDPVEIQQTLLRFADEFSTHMVTGVEKLQLGTNAPDRGEILRREIALATEICAIASGPNAVANLLDMTVFVSVMRMTLEDQSQPAKYGLSAQLMLESSRTAETNIWLATAKVLKPEQQAEFRRAIQAWRERNPLLETLPAARAHGFAAQVTAVSEPGATKSGSVLGLLMVDPFAGMDPAVREIARTRLFAERALFVTQKMPMLLRLQTELLSLNAVEMPEVRQLVTNSTQLSASVDRFAGVAEGLPKLLSTEREEILKALQSQEKDLTPLLAEVNQALASGTQMSTSLNTTITTFDALMKRFGVGETNNVRPAKTNAEPFRIQNYTETAAQLEATARQLTDLLVTLDRTLGSTNLTQLSAQVGPVVQKAQTSGKEVVDYAFKKAILLVMIGLVAALIYRFLSTRFNPATHSKPNSS